jgi:hypothetical protein
MEIYRDLEQDSQPFIFFVIYEWAQKAGSFVPFRPFQPSLMFVSKAGAYLSEAIFRCPIFGTFLALPTNI